MKQTARLNSDVLHSRLKIRSLSSESTLLRNHPIAADFFKALDIRPGRIRDHAVRMVMAGALAGSVLLGGTTITNPKPVQAYIPAEQISLTPQQNLVNQLKEILPFNNEWLLTKDQENKISDLLFESFGLHAKAELEGNKLNNSWGRMGAEQHLPRFPGDTAENHGHLVEKGITPGKGGWGYFAYSQNDLTPELEQTERWYVAVQTLYLPNWNTDTAKLSKWYKYRRVAVVNPANGKVVIAAVADAGPSKWTGKHFGGSPEVMEYLGINTGMQNHPVVLFFVDDPEKKIPLGPLQNNIADREKFLPVDLSSFNPLNFFKPAKPAV